MRLRDFQKLLSALLWQEHICVLLVVSDKQDKTESSSKGDITQRRRQSGSLSSNQPYFAYVNTPYCCTSGNKLKREIIRWNCLLFMDSSNYHGGNRIIRFGEKVQMWCRLVFCKLDFSISWTLASQGEKKKMLNWFLLILSDTDQSTISSAFFSHYCLFSRQRYWRQSKRSTTKWKTVH